MTPPRSRLGPWTRSGLVLGAVLVMAVLGVARLLEPDPRGFGTHRRLGLAPCSFREVTGMHCPSCGMTTAFAHAARGQLGRSWTANPAGCLMALASPAMAAWMLLVAASGRPRLSRSIEGPLTWSVVAAVAMALLAWIFRIARDHRV